jgi:hypothetical protein
MTPTAPDFARPPVVEVALGWMLRRADQVGCLVFAPVDILEHRLAR